ncbi:hypothetical protein EXU57_11575 [Segetibacter sp. 3557_3]|uniref:hypothetical protein n=1 Tax=Segetibacter sp. 3557_3 TaxID=2547429 RepID=UPI001058EBED|nr:hypothetical protein [Segetibacter sp. 3557_3]TDH26126.1 hypothetical protein EXU57_11575 [Segetibacter sp. 3557_3]
MTLQTFQLLFQLVAPLFIGIIIGLVFRATFTKKLQHKVRDYRKQIIQCQSDLIRKEHEFEMLQQQLHDSEERLRNQRLFLN